MALTQVPSGMLATGAALANIGTNGITPSYLDSNAQYTGFKNRFINSAMMIDQRNAGGSYTVPAGGGYTIDRWHAEASQASKYTVQQNSGNAPTTQGFTQCLKVTSSSAYSLAAGDYFQIQQHIEGFNTADLNFGTASAKTVTLSFWVNASITGTYGLFIINGSSNRLYPTSYTVNSANTWEQKTITFTGDLSGTWGTTNGTGIRVAWVLGYGSTYTGATPNAWIAGGGLYVPSGCVNLLGTNGATLYITGAQFEKGSVATAFDYRSIGQELALCQRYFEKTYSQAFKPGDTTGYAGGAMQGAIYNNKGSTAGVNDVSITWQYKVVKRAVPTITFYAPSNGSSGNFTAGSTAYTAGINGPIIGDSASLGYGAASGGGNDCYFHMTASSEL